MDFYIRRKALHQQIILYHIGVFRSDGYHFGIPAELLKIWQACTDALHVGSVGWRKIRGYDKQFFQLVCRQEAKKIASAAICGLASKFSAFCRAACCNCARYTESSRAFTNFLAKLAGLSLSVTISVSESS